MTHVMVKGSNTALDVTGVRAVLQWTPGPGAPDVDASVLLLGQDGRVRTDADFVFYNEPRHPSGLARHLPKKRIPEGLTDTLEVDLAALDAGVDRVVIAASCDGGPFRTVRDLSLTLYDTAAPQHAAPVVTFEVVPDTGQETALICGELYRKDAGWKFRALAQGYASGLVGLATEYGVAVDDGEPAPAGGRTPDGRPASVPTAPLGAQQTPGTPMPAQEPAAAGAYGYPLQAPSAGHVPAQPAYGYPQPMSAPPATAQQGRQRPDVQQPPVHQQPQQGYPAYGYPQPVGAPPTAAPAGPPLPAPPSVPPAVSANGDGGFTLPPQGPQFQPQR